MLVNNSQFHGSEHNGVINGDLIGQKACQSK